MIRYDTLVRFSERGKYFVCSYYQSISTLTNARYRAVINKWMSRPYVRADLIHANIHDWANARPTSPSSVAVSLPCAKSNPAAPSSLAVICPSSLPSYCEVTDIVELNVVSPETDTDCFGPLVTVPLIEYDLTVLLSVTTVYRILTLVPVESESAATPTDNRLSFSSFSSMSFTGTVSLSINTCLTDTLTTGGSNCSIRCTPALPLETTIIVSTDTLSPGSTDGVDIVRVDESDA